jgi:hypothetical protein
MNQLAVSFPRHTPRDMSIQGIAEYITTNVLKVYRVSETLNIGERTKSISSPLAFL